MAIAYDTVSANTSSANATTLSVNHTAGAGDNRVAVVIVCLMRNATGGISMTSATYGGNAMTERATIERESVAASKTYRIYIYTYNAPPTSSTTVTANWNTNAIASSIHVLSFTGVDQTDPYDTNATNEISGSSTPVLDFVTTEANTMIVGGLMMRGGDTDPFTPDAATERYEGETGTDTTGDFGFAGGTIVAATATTYDFGWTASVSDGGVIAAINLREATAGTQYTQDLAGALTSSGTVVKMGGKPLAGALTSAGTVTKSAGKPLAGAIAPSGTVVKQAGKALAGAVTSSGTVIKSAGKALAGELTSAGAVAKSTAKTLAGELTSAGALAIQTAKTLAGSLSSAGNLARETRKSLAGALTSEGAVAAVKTVLVSLAGELTSAGTLARQTGKSLAGAIAPAGDVIRHTAKTFAGELTSSGTLARMAGKALDGALATAGAVSRQTGKALAGSLATAGTISRSIAKTLAGALSTAGTLVTEYTDGSIAVGLVALTARARAFALTARERILNLTVRNR